MLIRPNWAVLVAGSSGWQNFRHQSDVCHMYQILKKGGMSDNNIVTMFFDDIAYNPSNPYQGNIINYPNGSNVYKGVLKDYTGDNVTPENFLNVLLGNSSGVNNRKVLKSGPNDNVFIYMTDHGAPGLFYFPNDILYAPDFIDTLKKMHATKMFKNMMIYTKSCESGSMFDNLLPNYLSIYAITASTPQQPSYACYMDQKRGVYLNDCFSINFLRDDDNFTKGETLNQQYLRVTNETINSNVCQYGDTSLDNLLVTDFIGKIHQKRSPVRKYKRNAILSSRAKLHSIARKLEKESLKQINEIDLDHLLKSRHEFNRELDLLIDSHILYKKYNRRTVDFAPDQCHVATPLPIDCIKKTVKELFNNHPNEYQLETLKYLCAY